MADKKKTRLLLGIKNDNECKKHIVLTTKIINN